MPSFWGYLFLDYSLDPSKYNQNQTECQYLINWSFIAGVIFIIHSSFYFLMAIFALLGANNIWFQKFVKIVKFEDSFWRTFVVTFSLLAIFGILGLLNKNYSLDFSYCGDLYKLVYFFFLLFFI